jgi:hypothetical protein
MDNLAVTRHATARATAAAVQADKQRKRRRTMMIVAALVQSRSLVLAGGILVMSSAVLAVSAAAYLAASYPLRDRYYLTNASLTGAALSAMRCLLDARVDGAYVTMLGFNVFVFELLLNVFDPRFPLAYGLFVNPGRLGTSAAGRPPSLSSREALALVLWWLVNPGAEKVACMLFGVGPAVICRFLTVGRMVLLEILREMPECAVQFPSLGDQTFLGDITRQRLPALGANNIIGFIDGIRLKIQTNCVKVLENLYYSGYCAAHVVCCIFLFLVNGKIAWASLNNPGSFHDATCALALTNLLDNSPTVGPHTVVAADAAFNLGEGGHVRKCLSDAAYRRLVVQRRTGVITQVQFTLYIKLYYYIYCGGRP